MSKEKFKLSSLEVLKFALEGVNTTIGTNVGNPSWTREDWEYHIRTKDEIERRIKIVKSQEKFHAVER